MSDGGDPLPANPDTGSEPGSRIFALRWTDGRVERAMGKTAAAAVLSLGYGVDDFKDITWEEQV